MGQVVDAHLKVYGTENLYVVCASVMPGVVRGNTYPHPDAGREGRRRCWDLSDFSYPAPHSERGKGVMRDSSSRRAHRYCQYKAGQRHSGASRSLRRYRAGYFEEAKTPSLVPRGFLEERRPLTDEPCFG